MRQLVYTMLVSNNRTSFYLWWKKNLVKYQKISKCYENDCYVLNLWSWPWICKCFQYRQRIRNLFWKICPLFGQILICDWIAPGPPFCLSLIAKRWAGVEVGDKVADVPSVTKLIHRLSPGSRRMFMKL